MNNPRLSPSGLKLLPRLRLQRGAAFGLIIIVALFAFEIFNYSTTEYALSDLLGELRFAGVLWSTILAIAFCGIDFAGIARLFTPEQGADEPNEVWYLFGAWLLAATMNAMLTWWGVSLALIGHQTLGNAVIEREQLLRIVPIFVAVMVWLIRVLIIGTFSVAGERLFSQAERRLPGQASLAIRSEVAPTAYRAAGSRPGTGASAPLAASSLRGVPRNNRSSEPGYPGRPEPSYHPISMAAADEEGAPVQATAGNRLPGRKF